MARYSPTTEKITTKIAAGDGFDETFDVVSRPTTGMVMDASDAASNGERGIRLALALIQSWSLVDDAGQPLPITLDTMRALPVRMIQPVMEHVAKVMGFLQTTRT